MWLGATALSHEDIISVAVEGGSSKLLSEFGGISKTNIFINPAHSFCQVVTLYGESYS